MEKMDNKLLWGPYLSERQWGTVREDHSIDKNCWEDFTYREAAYRSYRYGEDGLFGVCDVKARLCLASSLWNGKDGTLKERLFGLTNPQGNHGEDVKECYFYLDSLPDHSYMKALYKYPQAAFPYQDLVDVNRSRSPEEEEYELLDTGIFDEDHYWDVYVEYAKASPTDILCRYTVYNRGPEAKDIHIIPTLWFRNTWDVPGTRTRKPSLHLSKGKVVCEHKDLGTYEFTASGPSTSDQVKFLFTENETNPDRLSQGRCWRNPNAPVTCISSRMDADDKGDEERESSSGDGEMRRQTFPQSRKIHIEKPEKQPQRFYKDAFHRYIIKGDTKAVNPAQRGTKCGAYFHLTVPGGDTVEVRCRLYIQSETPPQALGESFDAVFRRKKSETDDFYKKVLPTSLPEYLQNVARQAYAGLLWSKQFYCYNHSLWTQGKTAEELMEQKFEPQGDIMCMPDKWEFPWFAAWDHAFQAVALSDLDISLAKQQLMVLLSDRYMMKSGQMPGCEFDLHDPNPPIQAWACLRIYKTERSLMGQGDLAFLEDCFKRLQLNYQWWLKVPQHGTSRLFSGGFLGLDNISVIDRSHPPIGHKLLQADATGWVALFSLNMMEIAMEINKHKMSDSTSHEQYYKELFLSIKEAINNLKTGLWDEEENFYFDHLIKTSLGREDQSKSVDKSHDPQGTCTYPKTETTSHQSDSMNISHDHGKKCTDPNTESLTDQSDFGEESRDQQDIDSVSSMQTVAIGIKRHIVISAASQITSQEREEETQEAPEIKKMKLDSTWLPGATSEKHHSKLLPRTERKIYRIKSLVGIVPLLACCYMKDKRPLSSEKDKRKGTAQCFSLLDEAMLRAILSRLLDGNQFLSPHGVRSLSKAHRTHRVKPGRSQVANEEIRYCPGESDTDMFGGNSNWRGPVWICMNFMIAEALEVYGKIFGDDLRVECPSGSKQMMTLTEVAAEIMRRNISLFQPDQKGRRPWQGDCDNFSQDPHWKDLSLFHEYFHGDSGRGCGASHQTGWTALIITMMKKLYQ